MKNVQSFLIFFCLCIPLGLFAQNNLEGTWQTKVPAEDGSMMNIDVTFQTNGTYSVDMGGDGTVDITGKYEINDGQMTFQDTGGPESCDGKAVYKLEVSASTMKMTRVSDPCEGRGGPEGVMAFNRI